MSIWNFLMALVGVYFLVIIILMEISINWKAGRGKRGALKINQKGFAIKWIYKANFLEQEDGEKQLPKDICQLFYGYILWPGYLIIIAMILIIFLVLGFFGFFLDFNSGSKVFHKYQRWGKEDKKKWIAPWKIVLVWLIYKLVIILFSQDYTASLNEMNDAILPLFFIYFSIMVVLSGAAMIVIFQIILATPPLIATKEWIKAIKSRSCILLEISD